MRKDPFFPTSVWDGLTNWRPALAVNRSPDPEDWDELLAEIMAVETAVYASQADDVLWVAPHGVAATATGTITNPYLTLAAAIAAVTSTKKTICMMPGTYTTIVSTTLPTVTGCSIIGVGGSAVTIIDQTVAGDEALKILPANAAAYEILLKGLTVQALATKNVLDIDDTGATATSGTITVNLDDVVLTHDTSGSSINVVHAVAMDLTIIGKDCYLSGEATLVCVSATDVFTFERCDFPGGLASTGAYAAVHTFVACDAKENGMSGNAAAIVMALYCTAVGKTLLANSTDFHTFAGGGTLITPTSA